MSIWRPHTTGILIGGLVLILVALVGSFMLSHFKPTTQVSLGSGVFSVKVATNDIERERGLSGVDALGSLEGLLMVFDTDGRHGIWMKDMNIPIDIVWLDSNKTVVYMVTEASPQVSTEKIFTPKDPALYVLELSAGSIQKSGIKIGSKAEFVLEGESQ